MIDSSPKNIKYYRELKGYSQQWVAKALSMSQPTYSNIECGKTRLSIKTLKLIATLLDVKVDELIRDEPPKLNGDNTYAANTPEISGEDFAELKRLYERLLTAKDNEIKYLRELLSEKTLKLN